MVEHSLHSKAEITVEEPKENKMSCYLFTYVDQLYVIIGDCSQSLGDVC